MKNEPQQPQQPQTPEQPKKIRFNGDDMNKLGYVTMRCPKCGSPNISFVSEYHKNIKARIAIVTFVLLSIIPGIIFLINLFDYLINHNSMDTIVILTGVFAGICLVVAVLIKLTVYFEELCTHIKGICRTCGHIWLVD